MGSSGSPTSPSKMDSSPGLAKEQELNIANKDGLQKITMVKSEDDEESP